MAVGLSLSLLGAMAQATEPVVRIDGSGRWRLAGEGWDAVAGDAATPDPVKRGLLPDALGPELDNCAKRSSCLLSEAVQTALTEQAARAAGTDQTNREVTGRYTVVKAGTALAVSLQGQRKEMDLVTDSRYPFMAIGDLGVKAAYDARSGTVYSFRCDDTYRCVVYTRRFAGEAATSEALNLKLTDVLSWRGRLFAVGARPVPKASGGSWMKVFSRGPDLEDWSVLELDERLRIKSEQMLVRGVEKASGAFDVKTP